ncbi:MAG TPA: chaperone modulator CbpM [Burkholderiales bacterium]|nr:chaperone modulator CbpM [Burkholderiales bacterium]
MRAELTEAVWLDERAMVSLIELAQCSGLSEQELRELIDLGALAPDDPQSDVWQFTAQTILTARTACRLRNDFELDAPGLALALTLLERIRELEAQVRHLEACATWTRR